MLFIYKNGGASVGDIICVSHGLAVTFDSEDDVTDRIVIKQDCHLVGQRVVQLMKWRNEFADSDTKQVT